MVPVEGTGSVTLLPGAGLQIPPRNSSRCSLPFSGDKLALSPSWFGLQKATAPGILGLWRASLSPEDGRLHLGCGILNGVHLLRYKIS